MKKFPSKSDTGSRMLTFDLLGTTGNPFQSGEESAGLLLVDLSRTGSLPLGSRGEVVGLIPNSSVCVLDLMLTLV